MIRSMTAFAHKQLQTEGGTLTWEIRSVNHRYLEPAIRLPDCLRTLETSVREVLKKQLSRGKIDCNLRFQRNESSNSTIEINQALTEQLITATQQINALLKTNANPVQAMELLNWPGIVQSVELDAKPLQATSIKLFEATLSELRKSREREGEKLQTLIRQRCDAMESWTTQIKTCLPQVLETIRQTLSHRLAELKSEIDQSRLEQELVLLIQKLDVDEELDRLAAHIIEVRRVLTLDEPVGRRLDFLMQELNRETNTIASKSASAEITRISIEMKVLIEQMREQVQNIE
ncbi:MAG: YicC family protein [Gammaproteobacteria bacterium]|nr:YicC family protein [Gammaproteobacteria bacterium]